MHRRQSDFFLLLATAVALFFVFEIQSSKAQAWLFGSAQKLPEAKSNSDVAEDAVIQAPEEIFKKIVNKLEGEKKKAVNNVTEVNDCLGLGQMIAANLESILKNAASGAKAQEARFFMSSRKKPLQVEVMLGKQFGLEWTDFEVKRNTVVTVHGFLSNGNESWIQDLTKAFLLWGDVNVIAVDWSAGGDTYNYYKAVFNTQTTGKQISILFDHIANDTIERNGPPPEEWGSIHCVGHSLGSHICGYAADQLKKTFENRWKVHRITGLDPAQPCFKTVDLSLKLDKTDAPFVDVIHTNGRFLTDVGLGLPQPIGHVDFFPNGGKRQPGCEVSRFRIPILTIPREIINRAICSHGKSYLYFTESLRNAATNNCTFWAHPWDLSYRNIQQTLSTKCNGKICTEMGINSEKYKFRGTYFVLTSGSEPFCYPEHWDVTEVDKILKEDFKESLKD